MKKKGFRFKFLRFNKSPCDMCLSARVDPELNDNNDFSAYLIGCAQVGHRFMLCSGSNRPVRIDYEIYDEEHSVWNLYGNYYPKYCPNCGRLLSEYLIDNRGRNFKERGECDE